VPSLFLSSQSGVGPSISSSVVESSVFLMVCVSVPVLAVYFCPSSVRVVATFSGTALFLFYIHSTVMAAILILVMNLWFRRELAVVLDHISNYMSSQQELCFVELH